MDCNILQYILIVIYAINLITYFLQFKIGKVKFYNQSSFVKKIKKCVSYKFLSTLMPYLHILELSGQFHWVPTLREDRFMLHYDRFCLW